MALFVKHDVTLLDTERIVTIRGTGYRFDPPGAH